MLMIHCNIVHLILGPQSPATLVVLSSPSSPPAALVTIAITVVALAIALYLATALFVACHPHRCCHLTFVAVGVNRPSSLTPSPSPFRPCPLHHPLPSSPLPSPLPPSPSPSSPPATLVAVAITHVVAVAVKRDRMRPSH